MKRIVLLLVLLCACACDDSGEPSPADADSDAGSDLATDVLSDATGDAGADTTSDPTTDPSTDRDLGSDPDAAPEDLPSEQGEDPGADPEEDPSPDAGDDPEPDVLDEPDSGGVEPFSDEFDDPSTQASWTLREEAEDDETLADTVDIDAVTDGFLVIDPNDYDDPDLTDPGAGAAWFSDRKGPFLFQLVSGDFAAEISVRVGTVADIEAAPTGTFNAGGFVVRDPDSHDPGDPDALGDEAWVMYNIGNQAGAWASEVKTTFPDGADGNQESDSTIFLTSIASLEGRLVVCRIGDVFRFFRRLEGDGGWTQEIPSADNLFLNDAGLGPDYSAGFTRPDMADTLQVGIIANRYTDSAGSPVRVQVDWFRLERPTSVGECTSLFD